MADTRLSDLSAAGALSASDLFYVVQTPGSGGEKATGTQLLTLVGTSYLAKAGGTMTGALTLPGGAVGTPSLMFTGSAATTGIYSPAPNTVAISILGTRRLYMDDVGGVVFTNTSFTSGGLFTTAGNMRIADASTLGWSSTVDPTATQDVILRRDAAATLAQRNGATQQIFRLYNTYTDASNYERLTLTGVAGASVNITAETLGTGGDNIDIVLTPAGTGALKIGAVDTGANFLRENLSGFGYGMGYYSSGIVLGRNGDPAMWIKQAEVRITSTVPVAWASSGWSGSIDTALFRGAAGQVDVTNGTAGTWRDLKLRNLLNVEYHQMTEMTAPSAPATNSVRIYAEDNGSGKTRLMALFATGSAVQIAIEP